MGGPIAGADRIVLVSNLYPKFGFGAAGPATGATSVPDYFDRRRDVRSFDEAALYRRGSVTLDAPNGPERLNVLRATPSFYSMARISTSGSPRGTNLLPNGSLPMV